MKRTIFCLFLPLFLQLCFVSCGDDDDFSGEIELELMYGTWIASGYPATSHNAKIEFRIDKRNVTVFQNGEEVENYTYEMSEDHRTLLLTEKWGDELSATAEILGLNESSAKLRITDLLYGLGSYTISLKRVQ